MFKKIGAILSKFFSTEVPVLEEATTKAVSLVNVLKTFAGSATGQMVEAIIEALLPGTGMAVITGLNVFFADFGLITGITGTAAEQAAAGLNKVASLTGKSKVYALSNISSIIANEADNANGGKSTPQQTIVATPVVYNPSVLDTGPNESIAS